MLWVDFSGDGHATLPDANATAFIAATYSIISLEKCFASTYSAFNEVSVGEYAARLKALNPSIKILYYYNSVLDFSSCYLSGAVFAAHPEWRLLNGSGAVEGKAPWQHDTLQAAVRDYWSDSILNASAIITAAHGPGLLDGVFADKMNGVPHNDINASTNAALTSAKYSMANGTRSRVRAAMGPTAKIIANALNLYPQDPKNG